MSTESERRVAQGEIIRRVTLIEGKLDNGLFVRKDVYTSDMKGVNSSLEEVKDQNKWLMRLLVAQFLVLLTASAIAAFQIAT